MSRRSGHAGPGRARRARALPRTAATRHVRRTGKRTRQWWGEAHMLISQAVVTALLATLLLNTLNNLRLIRRLHPRPHPASRPLVSILVPARNEARTIARCVISLLRQDYPCCEVLDDESPDPPPGIVHRAARRYPQLRPLRRA